MPSLFRRRWCTRQVARFPSSFTSSNSSEASASPVPRVARPACLCAVRHVGHRYDRFLPKACGDHRPWHADTAIDHQLVGAAQWQREQPGRRREGPSSFVKSTTARYFVIGALKGPVGRPKASVHLASLGRGQSHRSRAQRPVAGAAASQP